jgi:uncharacterized membrane-anchored protein YjiN (DUF445 family)
VPDAAEVQTLATPPLREADRRRAELRTMQRRATGLLVVMAVFFVIVSATTDASGATGYLRAATEASLVGGLADWFAVTALFRHPLGLPIPHTAVIRERKDQFGRTLGEFVQENFLSPAIITERVRAARVPARASAWLADRANAEVVASRTADLLVGLADVVRDEDVQQLVHEQISRAVESVPLAPLAGRALQMATADGRHQEVLAAALRGVERAMAENEPQIRAQFEQQSPWWLPGAVEDRIFERLFDGLRALLVEVAANPEHSLRARLDQWLDSFIERLATDPGLRSRGEDLKHEVMAHPAVREWSAGLWGEVKASLRAQAAAPDSELRRRLADMTVAAGTRLRDDVALAAKAEELLENGVRYMAETFDDELARLISSTVERWDAEETSDKLELLLGRDLQFIRINGTVVGGLAGVAIHGIAALLR